MNSYPKIAVSHLNGMTFLYKDHILYAASNGNQTNLFTINGKKISIQKKLKDVLQLLSDDSFIRIHHSHIINLKHISLFENKRNNLRLSDGTNLTVARSRRNEFLERFTKL